MLFFQPITLSNKETIQLFLSRNLFDNCELSFSNLFTWAHASNTLFSIWKEQFLFIRFQLDKKKPECSYLFPIGEGNIQTAFEELVKETQARNEKFQLSQITPDMFYQIEEIFPEKFLYQKERSLYDYIYSSYDLIHLNGKKYQAKRNHINKFKRTYQWEYIPITKKIIPDCLQLYERWHKENEGKYLMKHSLIEERIATKRAFDHYEYLDLKGGVLLVEGEIVAYSYGRELTKNMFGIHAEKCLYEIDGGFAMMNQQFAQHYCEDYLNINREEDLGIETLRQAKLSYHPTRLLEKGKVYLKN